MPRGGDQGELQCLKRKWNRQACVPASKHPDTLAPTWILSLCSITVLGLCPPLPWCRDPLPSAALGGSGGQDSGAGLPGFKSKVTQQLVKLTQWLCDLGQVTSFSRLCNEGGDGSYIQSLHRG